MDGGTYNQEPSRKEHNYPEQLVTETD
jgi:hypothetical protein